MPVSLESMRIKSTVTCLKQNGTLQSGHIKAFEAQERINVQVDITLQFKYDRDLLIHYFRIPLEGQYLPVSEASVETPHPI